MIYVACGSILIAIGVIWLINPAKRPNRIYGYWSYLAITTKESFKLAQKWAASYFILYGGIQLLLGVGIHYLKWDRYFLCWLLTFYLFIIFPIASTETKLKKYLLARHELPADYVNPDDVKHEKVKGFKDQ